MNAKRLLSQLLKHRFWIICGVVVLVGLGAWYVASADLRTQTSTQMADITSYFSKANGITAKGIETKVKKVHPNNLTYEETNKLIQRLKQQVETAWTGQYEHQKNLFVWPERLSEEFRASVQNLRPIETTVPYPTEPQGEIPITYRVLYRDFITTHIPTLADIIGARWHESAVTTATADPARTAGTLTESDIPIVDWSAEDQGRLKKKISLYPGQESNQNIPSTLQLLYAQEDLWVLTSILNIIKATNGDADAYYQAVITHVNSILIGTDVKGAEGAIQLLAGASGAFPDTAGTTIPEDGDPATGRYVDRHYVPLSGSQLRASYTTTDPAQAYLSVAKRMPIRLSLVMDQRLINRLLTECANSKLPVEVRQVRINRTGAGGTSFVPRSTSRFGGNRAVAGQESSSSGATGRDYHFRSIEIYGVIYIYNPVPTDKLTS